MVIADKVINILNTVWNYDLVIVSGNHIKIANIVLALSFFLIGIKYSPKITLSIKNCVKTKISHDKDTVPILEKVILYSFFTFFIITVLQISNIPLSTFAFVGGGLAIGFGFGAQTIIANFVSSIIIIIERSIKIGDLVETEGVTGVVTSIGLRCITLTTPSNVEVLVPNTKLMQNLLVNWTLSDNIIKYQVEVKILKDLKDKINTESLTEIFNDTLKGQKFILNNNKSQIFLIKIEETSFTFLLTFYYNLQKVSNQEYVKNAINSTLLQKLKDYNFSINYPKIIEIIKPPLEKEK